jgi:GNAT superfamily N-acetyltransferase
MKKGIRIREARMDDCGRICELNRTALGYDYPEDMTCKRLGFILQRPTERVFVAEYEGGVAGYVHACDYECIYMDSLKNILAIAVDERYRGFGIGKKLLGAAEAWADKSGCAGVRLVSSMSRTGAHEFYKRCGYTLRKEQKNFIKLFFKPVVFERIVFKDA